MREIKFRAWDKEKKVIVKFDLFTYPTIQNVGSYGKEKFLKEYELMQYTGLKDKNGKEIYEGDIIQYDNDEKTMDKWVCGEKAVVVYTPARFLFRMNPFDKNELGNINVPKEGECEDVIEVIGNIYENKELVHKK